MPDLDGLLNIKWESDQNIRSMRRDFERQRDLYSDLISDLEQATAKGIRLHKHDAGALIDDIRGIVDDLSTITAQIHKISGRPTPG
jgi:hypothetical protein